MSVVTQKVLVDSPFNVIIRTTVQGATAISFPQHEGTGLSDLEIFNRTVPDTYTGSTNKTYVVEIDGTGTPDTFKWSDNGGSTWNASGVGITGANQVLNDGIVIYFLLTTGHTLADKWTFEATLGDIAEQPVFSMPASNLGNQNIIVREDNRNYFYVDRIHYNAIGASGVLYFTKDETDNVPFFGIAPNHSFDIDFTGGKRYGGQKNEFALTDAKILLTTNGLESNTFIDFTIYTTIIADASKIMR
jgi:hypothetical protein